MGCASSKRVEVAVAAGRSTGRLQQASHGLRHKYHRRTVSYNHQNTAADDEEKVEEVKKPIHVPLPILEKLETGVELAPNLSWSEVSKALQDIKPSLETPPKPKPNAPRKSISEPRKSTSEPPPELTGRRPVKENSFILRDRQERESNKARRGRTGIKWLRGLTRLAPQVPGKRIPTREPRRGLVSTRRAPRAVRRMFEGL
ncbi:uncharacterized protein A4U43_C06F16420 [Asparagus officinalis]|uniref:Uncharacterized protein n=1 Tax=Asparagus officinalis TaxID=4686 RepID=A0A5P1EMB2_ASPOF|nr:uncharacterized protein A4U43_C06F16420 [Asparagus officinalis]